MARTAQYVDLAGTLAARWADLAPGTLVESEHQVADEFGVNRLTAREAFRELERQMLVRRVMGRGTFTAYRMNYLVELGGVASFHRNVEAAGHTATTEVLGESWVETATGRALTLERVGYVDGFVAVAGRNDFPDPVGAQIEGKVVDGVSMHQALEDLGYTPRRSEVTVGLEIPDPATAELLAFSNAVQPTWHVRSETIDTATGTCIHRSSSWMRADMFEVTVRVGAPVGM